MRQAALSKKNANYAIFFAQLGIPPYLDMAKIKPLPMPLEPVLHSKHMQFAAGSVYRAILAVSCAFWAGGACLDGFNDAKAAQISRMPVGAWNAIKSPVMSALADILPELATRHAMAQATRDNMRRSIAAAQTKGRMVMFERRQARKAATEENKQPEPVRLKTPHKAARYVNESACMAPHELAALPRTTANNALLLDK